MRGKTNSEQVDAATYEISPAPGLLILLETLLYETSPQPMSSDIKRIKFGVAVGVLDVEGKTLPTSSDMTPAQPTPAHRAAADDNTFIIVAVHKTICRKISTSSLPSPQAYSGKSMATSRTATKDGWRRRQNDIGTATTKQQQRHNDSDNVYHRFP